MKIEALTPPCFLVFTGRPLQSTSPDEPPIILPLSVISEDYWDYSLQSFWLLSPGGMSSEYSVCWLMQKKRSWKEALTKRSPCPMEEEPLHWPWQRKSFLRYSWTKQVLIKKRKWHQPRKIVKKLLCACWRIVLGILSITALLTTTASHLLTGHLIFVCRFSTVRGRKTLVCHKSCKCLDILS
jgi:hypothetical protein